MPSDLFLACLAHPSAGPSIDVESGQLVAAAHATDRTTRGRGVCGRFFTVVFFLSYFEKRTEKKQEGFLVRTCIFEKVVSGNKS